MNPPEKKNILIALTYYTPYMSGLTEYCRLMAENLVTEYNITILTNRHDAELPSEEMICGVRVIRANPLLFLHKGIISPDFFIKFVRLAKRADLLHLHLPMFESGILSLLYPSARPVFITYHCDVIPVEKSLFDTAAVFTIRLFNRFALTRSTLIHVLSADYAKGSEALRGLESKTVAVYPFVKDFAVHPRNSSGHPVIGFLGRFVREKGIDVLLKAIPLVLERYPDAQFLLAGENRLIAGGSMYDEIKERVELLKGNVTILGRLPENSLQDFFDSIDLLTLPSTNSYEAFGMVQVEAMKAGVLVVASNLRGVRVPIKETGFGILVEPHDPLLLARAIIDCLGQRDTVSREAVSQKTKQIFLNSVSMEKMKSLYEDALRNRGSE